MLEEGTAIPWGPEVSQGVGSSKPWVRAGSYFHSRQPMAAKGTSHGHVQGLRWPLQAPGDRIAKDSLIRLDSSPQGLLSLEPLGELRRQGSQSWLGHRSPLGHLALRLRSACSKQCLLAKDAKCLPGHSY